MSTAYYIFAGLGGLGVLLFVAATLATLLGAIRREPLDMLPRYIGWSVGLVAAAGALLISALVALVVMA